ncbi:hypothetical protein Lbys_2255 [Leadbetterella byssophila DSM 17132]|uniref:Uncharacterized protein n=1 Tax=Leadbetterella byssophila (strain DSM 17132 / JCM 16389 / KACC 11308 / NBRC 106382 / 4M15) TaxID=649349 RepID=E4RVN3_LEAB4|nr:hypothetical protein [Leadbetterella byssophila]ADQ17932.1 hypothetical protein Lbys_2255 [Leadbetterella byssophila DSM 17132]
MKNYFKVILLTLFTTTVSAQEKAFQFGFFPPLSTNGSLAHTYTNGASFNVIAGVSKCEKYFSLSSVAGIIRENAGGLHIAGVHSHVGQEIKGAQIAGFSSYAKKGGVQISGFNNLSESSKVQVAGFTNVTQNSDAVQIAGFLNTASSANTQIAGFLNVGGKVKGVQISGFMNVADSSDYPIGIINIVKNGEKSLGVSYDETGTLILGFRSGGRVLYGIVGVGYTFNDYYAAEAGLGAVLWRKGNFRLKAEATHLMISKFDDDYFQKSSFKVLPSITLANRVEVFGGPSINYCFEDIELSTKFPDRRVFSNTDKPFLGYTAGIAVKF